MNRSKTLFRPFKRAKSPQKERRQCVKSAARTFYGGDSLLRIPSRAHDDFAFIYTAVPEQFFRQPGRGAIIAAVSIFCRRFGRLFVADCTLETENTGLFAGKIKLS